MTDDGYYEVLQVHPRAELDVIRAAFRTLARKYHPDAGGTGARMASLNEAWSILGDCRRRAAYDAVLAERAISAAEGGAAHEATTARAEPQTSADSHRAGGLAGFGRHGSTSTESVGRVLDFGRYAGWSLPDLARHDPTYLEWLERTPIGRPFRAEIEALLVEQAAPARAGGTATAVRKPFRLGRRRR